MRLNYRFVSEEKKVAIAILSPKNGIECFCRQCKNQWRTAKFAILVVIKHKLYSGCDWFPGKDEFPEPSKGKVRWVYCFELIGPEEASRDYCRGTEICRHHNEYSTPVLSNKKEAEKFRNEVLNSLSFKGEGDISLSTVRVTWSERWPKYNKGVYKVN